VKHQAAVIDTNAVVAGLITADAGSATARVLDGMRRGAFPFLLSDQLLAEYREVLLRPKIRKFHGLTANEVDQILTEIATHAIVREPATRTGAPDTNDNHLWSLLLDLPGSVLVTGDLALARKPPRKSDVLSRASSPRSFRAGPDGMRYRRCGIGGQGLPRGTRVVSTTGSAPRCAKFAGA